MNLSEANVLVTGGAGGIGRHLAERMLVAARGVAVFDKEAAVCALAETLPAARCYPCDVADPGIVTKAITELETDGFLVDVLINNAGLLYSAPLINMLEKNDRVHSAEEWQKVLAVNLSSVFYVTGRVVDQMLKRRKKGAVISISSICANGNAGQSAYSAAKAGVNALTRTWAKELGRFGIRFVSIAPGFVDTLSTREALSETNLARVKSQIPLNRLGEMEHIYQTVRFIIENDYVNGTVVEVDGGLVM
jgi:3-oxoacyl-[acyl-carrier protein] reductase